MDASLVSRMKQLEDEERRLQKMYVDAQLSAEHLCDMLWRLFHGQRSASRWPDR